MTQDSELERLQRELAEKERKVSQYKNQERILTSVKLKRNNVKNRGNHRVK